MSHSFKRLLALGLILGIVVVLPFACGEKSSPPAAALVNAVPSEPLDTTPREVELSDAKMSFRDSEIVMFEVRYRVTKGQPQPGYEYRLEVAFPGTTNRGLKPLVGREVQQEAVLKD